MTQAQAPQLPEKFEAPIGLKGVIPQNIQELFQLADMAVQSGLAPRGVNKVQAAGIMAFGMELGMTPLQSLGCISFINGKAAVYGDGITGLIHQSGHLERMEETIAGEGDARTATCRMWRRGNVEPFVGRFSVGNAKQAGLWGKNTWAQYPDRMLTHRARGWAARDGFSDCLKGLWTREEAEDMGHSNGRPLVSQSRSLEPKTFPEKAGNYQGKVPQGPPVAQDSKILDQVDRDAREEMAEADRQAEAVCDLERDAQEAIYGKPDVKAAAPLSYPEEAEFSSVGQALQKTPPAQSGGDAGLDNEGLRMKYSGRLGMLVSDICDAEGLQGNDHAREVRGKKLITEFSLYNDKSFDSIRAKVSGAWMRTTYRKMQRFAEVELGITAKE